MKYEKNESKSILFVARTNETKEREGGGGKEKNKIILLR